MGGRWYGAQEYAQVWVEGGTRGAGVCEGTHLASSHNLTVTTYAPIHPNVLTYVSHCTLTFYALYIL